MQWMRMVKEMMLLGALRAVLFMLTLIGKELAFSDEERRAVLDRIEAALLAPKNPDANTSLI